MKPLSMLLLLLAVAACGKEGKTGQAGQPGQPGQPGASSSQNTLISVGQCSKSLVLGQWTSSHNKNEILEFSENCVYTNRLCHSQGTFPANDVLIPKGQVRITVDIRGNLAPKECPAVAQTMICNYEVNLDSTPNVLKVNCGGKATDIFTRI